MNYKTVNDYLWYGYSPMGNNNGFLFDVDSHPIGFCNWSPEEAAQLLDNLIDKLLESSKPPHCVPLSGGWDSRIILAALRKRLNSDEVFCVSFGCPGQLDFEISKLVAKNAGVRHFDLNLNNLEVSWNGLKESVLRSGWTYVPDAYVQHAMFSFAEKLDSTLWVGFLGDPLTGSHYNPLGSNEITEAEIYSFSQRQKRVKRYTLTDNGYDPTSSILLSNEKPSSLSASEFLDFSIRQKSCIAPIVLPSGKWSSWSPVQGSMNGKPVMAPFCDIEWASYWLNMPRDKHNGQRLYRLVAERSFPELFRLPSKYTWGKRPDKKIAQKITRLQYGIRNRTHRYFPSLPIRSNLMDNYMDFQAVFRKRDDYFGVVEKALETINSREATPWLDLDNIWKDHYRGRRDHSQALQVLLGLALNLEAYD